MTWVRAHTNIALIKYWGKRDEVLKLPYNSSLSLTLDAFYTDTQVVYDPLLQEDHVILNGQELQGLARERVVLFMDEVRRRYHLKTYAHIESLNHVATAAGLASSASAFAALAKAATLDLNLDDQELSRLARLGSGSASRSIFGDFVIWHRGEDDQSSYAEAVVMEPWSDFRMIVCILNDHEKPYSSSEAMRVTEATSPYFSAWIEQSEKDLQEILPHLLAHDIQAVGLIAQTNALRMHASLLASNMWYFEPRTLEIMNCVRKLQQTIPVYFTIDAGPNVKIMTTEPYVEEVLRHLDPQIETVVCKAGQGVHIR